jgi:flavin-dependent dehydrogenase
MEEFDTFRRDVEPAFMRSLDLIPDFAARVRAGRREERFYGCSDLPNFYRKPYGSGWALVGDAGVHKDPFLALGISDAFRDAELLADAVRDGLGGSRSLADALADFERCRNDASARDYQENIMGARFTPLPPEALAARVAARPDPEAATRLVKRRMGMLPATN